MNSNLTELCNYFPDHLKLDQHNNILIVVQSYISGWLLAVGRALLLAQEISKFPSECMRADRMSAYYSSFDASSIQDAIRYEYENGLKVIEKESIPGKRFAFFQDV